MGFTTTLKEENRGLIVINRYWSRRNRNSCKKTFGVQR